jgi:hypothetical protein
MKKYINLGKSVCFASLFLVAAQTAHSATSITDTNGEAVSTNLSPINFTADTVPPVCNVMESSNKVADKDIVFNILFDRPVQGVTVSNFLLVATDDATVSPLQPLKYTGPLSVASDSGAVLDKLWRLSVPGVSGVGSFALSLVLPTA